MCIIELIIQPQLFVFKSFALLCSAHHCIWRRFCSLLCGWTSLAFLVVSTFNTFLVFTYLKISLSGLVLPGHSCWLRYSGLLGCLFSQSLKTTTLLHHQCLYCSDLCCLCDCPPVECVTFFWSPEEYAASVHFSSWNVVLGFSGHYFFQAFSCTFSHLFPLNL